MSKESKKMGRPLTDSIVAPWPELLRLEHGQERIAEKLGVSQTTVGKWARGVHRIPKLATRELLLLCKKNGITNGLANLEDA